MQLITARSSAAGQEPERLDGCAQALERVKRTNGAGDAVRSKRLRYIHQYVTRHRQILLDGSLDELLDTTLDESVDDSAC